MKLLSDNKYVVLPVEFATPAHDETVRLRDEVLRKPLGLEFSQEEMALESEDLHLACYDKSSRLLGCLVLSAIDEETIEMKQIAVLEKRQKKGIGTLLVHASELFSKQKKYKEIVLKARARAVPFYNGLDYVKRGKAFTEVSLKHYKMYKKLV